MARWPSALRGRGVGQDVADAELVLAVTAAVVGGVVKEEMLEGKKVRRERHGRRRNATSMWAAERTRDPSPTAPLRNIPTISVSAAPAISPPPTGGTSSVPAGRTRPKRLAPKWWKPFKYKLVHMLVEERDGSIYGAILEWDRAAALSEFIVMRPGGAPRAVLALRGTLLRSPTIRRDLEDDLRFLAWESLKGSVRFHGALVALKTLVDRHGSDSVCVGGHSLGAGFVLQVGKTMAKEGVFVECHLFNPPSVSLAMSLRSIGEKAVLAWKKLKAVLPANGDERLQRTADETTGSLPKKKLVTDIRKWAPHLYVNNSDYICCYYTHPSPRKDSGGSVGTTSDHVKVEHAPGNVAAKLFVTSKGPQRFLEAHGLQQWWSDDMELQLVLNQSKLMNRQLKSLYTLPQATSPQGKPP